MDKFVIKRSRAAEETQETQETEQEQETHKNQPPPLKFGGLKSLALCNPNPAILALESEAVRYFEQFPVDEWYNLGPYLHNRQLLFGPRPGAHRTPHEDKIPDVLIEMFKHARKSLLEESPYFGTLPEQPTGCAVNRYAVTENGKGNGLGPHRDKGAWIPLVVGVTLVESRKMSLSNDYKQRATERHTFTTEPGSVYAFRDQLYTKWYHESLKKGRSQKNTIYSITFRFLE